MKKLCLLSLLTIPTLAAQQQWPLGDPKPWSGHDTPADAAAILKLPATQPTLPAVSDRLIATTKTPLAVPTVTITEQAKQIMLAKPQPSQPSKLSPTALNDKLIAYQMKSFIHFDRQWKHLKAYYANQEGIILKNMESVYQALLPVADRVNELYPQYTELFKLFEAFQPTTLDVEKQ